jgi:hypothetical protein
MKPPKLEMQQCMGELVGGIFPTPKTEVMLPTTISIDWNPQENPNRAFFVFYL